MSLVGPGGGGTPPPPPAPVRRLVASLCLVALLGGGLVTARASETGPRVPETPFRADHPLLGGGRPEAVLYVSDTCPWCALELDAWGEEGTGPGPHPLVAFAPGSDPGALLRLPAPLATRAVLDVDGSLGRSLRVPGVPFLALVDGEGTVVAALLGISRAPVRRRVARHLHPAPDPAEAPR